jgi:hypothetical protein
LRYLGRKRKAMGLAKTAVFAGCLLLFLAVNASASK